jgi:hypothetical protein
MEDTERQEDQGGVFIGQQLMTDMASQAPYSEFPLAAVNQQLEWPQNRQEMR